MFNKRYYYVVRIQYLGYRFHGWQKQPKLKTVHLMIDRTLNFILEGKRFKTLGSGRTDAMVSANETAFELFLYEAIENKTSFLDVFNHNLPQDIRALAIETVDAEFNIIQHSKIKEYVYLFTYGQKCHPFCASLMTTILDDLDIDIMKKGAALFTGTHNFKPYCFRATDKGVYTRTIDSCELIENKLFTANFFPEKTYTLIVKGKGFGKNQIRLMMGTLIELGRGEIDLTAITNSLQANSNIVMNYVAPASGLILNTVEFE